MFVNLYVGIGFYLIMVKGFIFKLYSNTIVTKWVIFIFCLNMDCESFARRTFTTPKIRTFTTPEFGHFPPQKKNICQEDNCHPQFFFFFFWRTFLGFFDLQLMEDIKDGKEEVLDEVVMEHIK